MLTIKTRICHCGEYSAFNHLPSELELAASQGSGDPISARSKWDEDLALLKTGNIKDHRHAAGEKQCLARLPFGAPLLLVHGLYTDSMR
jgi:hypothetical protein